MKISGSTGPTLIGKQIVLGVTGSIAAFKAVGLLRTLLREGASVHVVMTQSATKFVTPLTFEVLSGHPVSTDVFEAHQEMKHLSLSEQADAIVIAPATANSSLSSGFGTSHDTQSDVSSSRETCQSFSLNGTMKCLAMPSPRLSRIHCLNDRSIERRALAGCVVQDKGDGASARKPGLLTDDHDDSPLPPGRRPFGYDRSI